MEALKFLETTVRVNVDLECVSPGERSMCGAFASGHYDLTKIGPIIVKEGEIVVDQIRFKLENKQSVENCKGHFWEIMGI